MLLERFPDQARLAADPKEIHVEQISESRLDRPELFSHFAPEVDLR